MTDDSCTNLLLSAGNAKALPELTGEINLDDSFVFEDLLHQRANIHPLITTGILVGGGLAVAAFVASKKRKTGGNGGCKLNEGKDYMADMNLEIKEHMEVIGSDGHHVGTVDKLEDNAIKLTRTDSPDGKHHRIEMDMVDTIEDGKLVLMQRAGEVKAQWGSMGDGGTAAGNTSPRDSGDEMTGDNSQTATGNRGNSM